MIENQLRFFFLFKTVITMINFSFLMSYQITLNKNYPNEGYKRRLKWDIILNNLNLVCSNVVK